MDRGRNNLLLYLIGRGISSFGTYIYSFVISLYILRVYQSTNSFALNILLGSVPIIVFAPVAGIVCSKYSKKKIVIVSDILNGVLFLVVYLLKVRGALTLNMIYLSTFISVSLMVTLGIAMDSMKPELVEGKKLITINSYGKMIDSMSSILGPVLGGIVFVLVDIEFFILINGISFIVSAILEGFLVVREVECEKEQEKGVSYKTIFKYAIKNESYLMIIKTAMLLNLFIGMSFQIGLPVLLNKVLEVSPTSYGVIQGSFSIGVIGGAIIINRNSEYFERIRRREVICAYLCGLVYLLVAIPLGVKEEVYYIFYYGVLLGAFGIVVAIYDVCISFIIQKERNSEYRSKIIGILAPLVKIFLLAGLSIGGYIVDRVSIYGIFLVSGILTIVITYTLIEGKIRKRVVIKEK